MKYLISLSYDRQNIMETYEFPSIKKALAFADKHLNYVNADIYIIRSVDNGETWKYYGILDKTVNGYRFNELADEAKTMF